MEIKYKVIGSRRKEMAHKIAEITGQECRYLFLPTYAYEIGDFTLEKDGTLVIPTSADENIVGLVLQGLEEAGFETEKEMTCFDTEEETDDEQPEEKEETADRLTVEMPADFFDEQTITNLSRIIENKANLFKEAFETDSLEFQVNEESVVFPWFKVEQDGDSEAYCEFIQMLCEFAKAQKRINNKHDGTDNPKYAMRCYLLRLGMIGEQFKKTRKVILRNLDGSSAFRHGGDAE